MNSPRDRYKSSYLERLKANVARYTPADKEALLAFRRAMYGASSVYSDPAYIEWLFERPPGADKNGPSLWIYRSEGNIEGQQGAIPVTLHVNGVERPAVWALDLMVSPKLRTRGIGPVLDNVAFEKEEIILGIEVSQAARSNYLRAGWVDAGIVPLYTRPLLARATLERFSGIDLGGPLGAVADVSVRAADAILGKVSQISGLRCEEVGAFDERAARLWGKTASSMPIAVARDLPYLEWRYNQYPKEGRYRILYFLRAGELRAWVVTRVGKRNGLGEGFLIDFAGSPEDLWCAFAQCIARFQDEGLAVVYCLKTRSAVGVVLRALGFLKRDSGWRLMAKVPSGDAALKDLFSNQSNWFITFGDCDADRPREGTTYAADQRMTPESAL